MRKSQNLSTIMGSQFPTRVVSIVALDILLLCASLLLAVSVRSQLGDPIDGHFLWDRLIPLVLVALPVILWRRLASIHPRYMGLYDLLNIAGVLALLGLVVRINESRLRPELLLYQGWNIPILFLFFGGLFLTGWRLARRVYAVRVLHYIGHSSATRRILIVGVCDEGEAVYRELSRDPRRETVVVGFVDDNPGLIGQTVHGLPVLSNIAEIPDIISKLRVTEVIIANPSLSSATMSQILTMASDSNVRVRTVPSLAAMVDGGRQALIGIVKDIDVEDLLKRESVNPDPAAPARYIAGERVMVTGGGGSIGSELVRQAGRFSPSSLIVLGKGEGSIFEIDQELRHATTLRPIPIICDVRDAQGLEHAFRTQNPTIVFHAAAHKHVPLMESVPIEAIRNNIFGTLNVAKASMRHHVKKFVLVSTDKAVNPSNVMGATKRVSEMIIQALANRSETVFAAVRFGNVLGSRGSLVPLIKKQIERGGPVTITHWDMTRYFMTIPEASDLILQAGAMGREGEIFVLDMEEPVKIVDLIKNLIRTHGFIPGQDIEIKCIGTRPGEKIHEELYFDAENVTDSEHPKIHKVVSNPIPWEWLKDQLDDLQQICDDGDQDKARIALMELARCKKLNRDDFHISTL